MGTLDLSPRDVLKRELSDPASPASAALSATYVRFVDQDGNPLASKHVTIKVDSTTGEILDIVAEA